MKKYENRKKLSLLFLLVLLPLVSAVNIEPDTIIQSTGLNTQFNFSISTIADSFQVETNSIYFQNFRRSGTEYITFNVTETNGNYLATALPYFSASSLTSKTITSGLTQSLDGTVTVDVEECGQSWTYKGDAVVEISCDGLTLQSVFNLEDIPNGNSILTNDGVVVDINCSSNTAASIIIILVFSALAIAALTFIIVMKFKEGELDLKLLIIVFIAIIVGLVLFTQIAQLTGGVCSS